MTIETAEHAASGVTFGVKALVGGGGVAFAITLAAVVVMVLKRPRSAAEWAVGLISTVVSSTGIGAAAILYDGLHKGLRSGDDAETLLCLMQMCGVFFACGLPGWVIVRVLFNTMTKFQDKSLDDAYSDVKARFP